MHKVDVKIMAVESRQLYAEYVLEQVKDNPTAQICYDPSGPNGCNNPWLNAKRIWSMKPAEGCEYKLVLQDDIDLVYGFLDYVDKCIAFQPDAVWTYFIGMDGEKAIKESSNTPYVKIKGCRTSGQAILMPTRYIAKMIEDTDNVFGEKFKNDDSRIGWWCLANRISMFTVNPMLVQHRAIKTTVVNHNAIRVSRLWRGKDIAKLNLNFDAKTYTETTTIYPYLWVRDDEINIDKALEYCKIAKQRLKGL